MENKYTNNPSKHSKAIISTVERLSATTAQVIDCKQHCSLPSSSDIREAIKTIKAIIFPGYFGPQIENIDTQSFHYGVNLEKLYKLMNEQIKRAVTLYEESYNFNVEDITIEFIESIPEIRQILITDVDAVFLKDPAAKSHRDVILCYPSINAVIHHRIAHKLLTLGVPLLPRIISEMAHSQTGIDIHPGVYHTIIV